MPRHPYASLQGQVSRLCAALRRAAPSDGRGPLLHDASGYRPEFAPGELELDARRFAELVARARAREAGPAPRARAELLGEALSLWRGEAYAGHTDDPAAGAAAARLEEERPSVREELLGLRVSVGEQCGWPWNRATGRGRPMPGSGSAWSPGAPVTSPPPRSTCGRCGPGSGTPATCRVRRSPSPNSASPPNCGGTRTLPGPCTPKDWRPRGRWETYAPWRWPWRGWRGEHISHVQIDVPEQIDIQGRAHFFEGTGTFR
ncbi:BTAD domain-containing putative transcriptional regulator, partial [Streptomyces goshikiensis]|uniref:AfsR/SARP family transcriptional regulator n=1 Tax=Streptomyces goshikiensis TaxID=1942 RepID=UPI0033D2DD19